MANLGRNLRFGFRLLGKDLGFTSVALLALTLGIGAIEYSIETNLAPAGEMNLWCVGGFDLHLRRGDLY
jgi:hypothetical protein